MTITDNLLRIRAEYYGALAQGLGGHAALRLARKRAETLGVTMDAASLEVWLRTNEPEQTENMD